MPGSASSANSASNVEPITCTIFPVAAMPTLYVGWNRICQAAGLETRVSKSETNPKIQISSVRLKVE